MRFLTNIAVQTEEELVAKLSVPHDLIALDIETVSVNNPVVLGIAIATSQKEATYFFNPRDVLLYQIIGCTGIVVAHNASFDIPLLESMGYKINRYEDSMLKAYSCGILTLGLEELSHSFLNMPYTSVTTLWEDKQQGNIGIDHVKLAEYCMQHALNTYNLWTRLPDTKLYRDIDRPCIDLVIEMEQNGVLVDQYRLTLVEQETLDKAHKLEKEIKDELGISGLNLASSKQVAAALMLKGIIGKVKTKAGAASVSDDSLKPLNNPLCNKILKWRSLMKTINTYLPAFRSVDYRGHIHTHFSYTRTGRWRSSDPNLQNLTRNDKYEDE